MAGSMCRPATAEAPTSSVKQAARHLLSSLHGLLEVNDSALQSQQGQIQDLQATLFKVCSSGPGWHDP